MWLSLLNFCVFLVLYCSTWVETKHITEYDDFCVADKVYKPYLYYYKGRKDGVAKGKAYKSHGPGLYSDIEENEYICMNGL